MTCLLDEIHRKYLQLYRRASDAGNVYIMRAEKEQLEVSNKLFDTAITTYDATITISDAFFDYDQNTQMDWLIQAMIRVIDMANIISSDQEWLSLVAPRIDDLRKRWKGSLVPDDGPSASDLMGLAMRVGLIDGGCAIDFNESFVIFGSDYFLNQKENIEDLRIELYLRNRLLSPSSRIDRFRRLYLQSALSTSRRQLDEAFSLLTELARDYPDALEVHASLSRLWGFRHNFHMMKYEAEQELTLLKRRHIPRYHHTYERAEGLLQDALAHNGY